MPIIATVGAGDHPPIRQHDGAEVRLAVVDGGGHGAEELGVRRIVDRRERREAARMAVDLRDGEAECGYCDRRFILKPGAKPHGN